MIRGVGKPLPHGRGSVQMVATQNRARQQAAGGRNEK